MPILRLAYVTLFLIAVIAVFVLWSQVGGQGHLDLMPWWLKLGLGAGAAFAVVRATMAAVAGSRGWNAGSLRWFGILLALLLVCGLVTYYYHLYAEDDDQEQDDTVTSQLIGWAAPRTAQQIVGSSSVRATSAPLQGRAASSRLGLGI